MGDDTRLTLFNEFHAPIAVVDRLAQPLIEKMAEQDAGALHNLKKKMEA